MRKNIANEDNAPEGGGSHGPDMTCARCEEGRLRPARIRTAFWHETRLVVVRNIPALVCQDCGEEFVGNRTALGLDHMRDNGFSESDAVEEMLVPVLDYEPGPAGT